MLNFLKVSNKIMTYNIYFDNICNNYLDLFNLDLTEKDLSIIIHYLSIQDQLVSLVTVDNVDFEDAYFLSSNGEKIKITEQMIPSEILNNSGISFNF